MVPFNIVFSYQISSSSIFIVFVELFRYHIPHAQAVSRGSGRIGHSRPHVLRLAAGAFIVQVWIVGRKSRSDRLISKFVIFVINGCVAFQSVSVFLVGSDVFFADYGEANGHSGECSEFGD